MKKSKEMFKRRAKKLFNVFGLEIVSSNPSGKNQLNDRFFPYFINKEIEGVKFIFFIGDSDGKEWYHTCATDPYWPEMKFIKDNIIKYGDIVFECGSHHGCTTLLLSEWVGKNGKVIGFEPNPSNFEIAKINLNINSTKNVELHNKAVGVNCEDIQIELFSSNSSVQLEKKENGNYYSVGCIDLDSLKNALPNVLKIDVEGFEKEVLLGASEILKTKPKLAIELHTEQLKNYNTTIDEIFSLLNKSNYDFWVQWDDENPPVPYNFEKQINKRVHLFGLPK